MRPQARLAEGLATELVYRHLGVKEDISLCCHHVLLVADRLHNLIVKVVPLVAVPMFGEGVVVASSHVAFVIDDREEVVDRLVSLHPGDVVGQVEAFQLEVDKVFDLGFLVSGELEPFQVDHEDRWQLPDVDLLHRPLLGSAIWTIPRVFAL
jgi:hypothetical protein